MPKVKEAYLKARREQVIDAALACFSEKGFHETTMKDIARQAGVSYGIVYHYFNSKEDIIEATWQHVYKAREAGFEKAQQKELTLDMLDSFVEKSLVRMEQPETSAEMRLRTQLFGEALLNPRIGDSMRKSWNNTLSYFEEILHHGQAKGEIDPDIDTRVMARVFMAVHDGIILQKALDPGLDARKFPKPSSIASCYTNVTQEPDDLKGLHKQPESPGNL